MDDRNEVIAHRRHVRTCIQIYKFGVFLFVFFLVEVHFNLIVLC